MDAVVVSSEAELKPAGGLLFWVEWLQCVTKRFVFSHDESVQIFRVKLEASVGREG